MSPSMLRDTRDNTDSVGKIPFTASRLPVVCTQTFHSENAHTQHYLSHKTICYYSLQETAQKWTKMDYVELFMWFTLFKWTQFPWEKKCLSNLLWKSSLLPGYIYIFFQNECCERQQHYLEDVTRFHDNFVQSEIINSFPRVCLKYVLSTRKYLSIHSDMYLLLFIKKHYLKV